MEVCVIYTNCTAMGVGDPEINLKVGTYVVYAHFNRPFSSERVAHKVS